MVIYIISSICVLIASVFVFFDHITINAMSILPIVLCLVSILQGFIFKKDSKEKDIRENTAYSTEEMNEEAYLLGLKWHSISKFAIVPLLLIFTLYFDTGIKVVCSIVISKTESKYKRAVIPSVLALGFYYTVSGTQRCNCKYCK